jgi:hypothetical protein
MTINSDHKRSLLSWLAGWWRSGLSPQASDSVLVADDAEAAPREPARTRYSWNIPPVSRAENTRAAATRVVVRLQKRISR